MYTTYIQASFISHNSYYNGNRLVGTIKAPQMKLVIWRTKSTKQTVSKPGHMKKNTT